MYTNIKKNCRLFCVWWWWCWLFLVIFLSPNFFSSVRFSQFHWQINFDRNHFVANHEIDNFLHSETAIHRKLLGSVLVSLESDTNDNNIRNTHEHTDISREQFEIVWTSTVRIRLWEFISWTLIFILCTKSYQQCLFSLIS